MAAIPPSDPGAASHGGDPLPAGETLPEGPDGPGPDWNQAPDVDFDVFGDGGVFGAGGVELGLDGNPGGAEDSQMEEVAKDGSWMLGKSEGMDWESGMGLMNERVDATTVGGGEVEDAKDLDEYNFTFEPEFMNQSPEMTLVGGSEVEEARDTAGDGETLAENQGETEDKDKDKDGHGDEAELLNQRADTVADGFTNDMGEAEAYLVSGDGTDVKDSSIVGDDVSLMKMDQGAKQEDGDPVAAAAAEDGLGSGNEMKAGEPETPEAVVAATEQAVEIGPHASCYLPYPEGDAGFSTSCLVWGKVKKYPWWPAEIFDHALASQLALKHRKQDTKLIAFFGDRSFAWKDETHLKPFLANFSQMAKQSGPKALKGAVDASLEEIARRVEVGLTCSCFPDEAYAALKSKTVDNTGIQEGTCHAAVDESLIVNHFDPDKLLEYLKYLAEYPPEEVDGLALVTVKAQLKSFYHFKGYSELPVLFDGGCLKESTEASPTRVKKCGDDMTDATPRATSSGKRKSRGKGSLSGKNKQTKQDGRTASAKKSTKREQTIHAGRTASAKKSGGRTASASGSASSGKGKFRSIGSSSGKRNRTSLDNSKKRKFFKLNKEEKDDPHLPRSSGKKNKSVDPDDTPDASESKKRKLDSFRDLDADPLSSRSAKVGERMSRIAKQMTKSPLIKSDVKAASSGNATRKRGRELGADETDAPAETSIIMRGAIEASLPLREVLAQLHLVAIAPGMGYSFLSTLRSFVIAFRDLMFSNTDEYLATVGSKRGRRKSAHTMSATEDDKSAPDLVQDSYFTGVFVRDHPVEDPEYADVIFKGSPERAESMLGRGEKKKMKSAGDEPMAPLDSLLDTEKTLPSRSQDHSNHLEVSEERTGEKLAKECTKTSLILSFIEPDALPSEAELVRIFCRFGPLEEAETEVQKEEKRARVVFRKRADAELVRIFCRFGPLEEAETEVQKEEKRARVVFRKRADAETAYNNATKSTLFGTALVSYRLTSPTLKDYKHKDIDVSPDEDAVAGNAQVDNTKVGAAGNCSSD